MSAPPPRPNPVAEAIKERFNLLGIAAAAGVAIAIPGALPAVLGVAFLAEAGYLVFAARSTWYALHLYEREQGVSKRGRTKVKHVLFSSMRPEVQSRFDNLEESRRNLVRQMPAQPEWFSKLLEKLDYLLGKFLEFASKEAEFRSYLQTVLLEAVREETNSMPHPGGLVKSQSSKSKWKDEPAPDPAEAWVEAVVSKVESHYANEVAALNEQRTKDSDDLTTNAVLDKRVEVIQRRREYLSQIGKITVNLNHQMELVEDTFGLISDEVRARPPEQVLADIDEVIGRTDSLTELLQGFPPPSTSVGAVSEVTRT